MSAKNSFNSMDPKAMQALLAVASRKLGTSGYATKRGYDASKGFVRSENCRENIVLTTGKGDIQKASGEIVFYRAKA